MEESCTVNRHSSGNKCGTCYSVPSGDIITVECVNSVLLLVACDHVGSGSYYSGQTD